MKRTISIIVLAALLLCLAPAGFAEGESFASLTGLDALQETLQGGVTVESVYYTDGYGFSTSEFTSTDPAEIEALLDALYDIRLGAPSEMSVTDWYPMILFSLSDGTEFFISFESHWLTANGKNYELENDGAFWFLTSGLVKMYARLETPEPTPEPTSEPEPEIWPNCVDLYFPSNPSTGYGWTVEIADEGIVESKDQLFEKSADLGLAGAAGTHWFHLDGVGEGMTHVSYRYARPWEDSALFTFTYRIQVDSRLNVLIWGVEMYTN